MGTTGVGDDDNGREELMRYLGGKSQTRNQIAAYLNRIRKPGQPYWEPFVGAGWVLEKIKGQPIYASDANAALVFMWQRLQRGWEPPNVVTEEMYQEAKAGRYDAALTAFIGFGCSFGGKWFAGYARGENRNWAQEASNSISQKSNRFEQAIFFCADFLTCYPPESGCLIYCDPPYEDTTAYGAVPPFDHSRFWERVRQLESGGHTVIVSEYQAPDDFSPVVEMVTKTDMHTTSGKDRRVERLFRLGQHRPLQPSLLSDVVEVEAA